MEQVLLGEDPDDLFADPIAESNDCGDSGDTVAAERLLGRRAKTCFSRLAGLYGSIFRDNAIEEIETGKDRFQIVQLASRNQDQLATGLPEFLQRPQGRIRYQAAVCKRSVIIRGESDISHTFP